MQRLIACHKIPVVLRSAMFTVVRERKLTAEMYPELLCQCCHDGYGKSWEERLDRRRSILKQIVCKPLIC